MARVYPRTLLAEDCKSSAERRVFDILEKEMPAEWEVFHSVGLMVRDPGEGARDDEADFVLCHPDKGIVCLEVKGGGIDCRYGEWYRTSRNGPAERIPDPFSKAVDHRYSLRRKLEQGLGQRRSRELFLVHALAFPDIVAQRLVLGPDAPAEIIVDRNDLRSPSEAVERILAYHRGAREKRRPPGEEDATALRDLLCPRISIPVTWAAEFVDEEEEMVLLTSEQSRLLRRVRRNPRMFVAGCAGSGKTMIAIEQAKRFARDGLRTLFVCFNKGLRAHVRDHLGAAEVQTSHGLCVKLANQAKLAVPQYPPGTAPPEFWSSELPEALVEAIEHIGPQFDAIVADEVQDFREDWIDALLFTLDDEENDPFWLFADANQRIYNPDFEAPTGCSAFDLTVNCRNTQEIHSLVLEFYEGEIEPESAGPLGRPPEVIHTSDQAVALAEQLEHLCLEEKVPRQHVTVLSAHSWEGSRVRRAYEGSIPLTKFRGSDPERIYFSSIDGFKGLESPVVVVCELEGLRREAWKHQLYVALSRARHHCVLLLPPDPEPAVDQTIQDPLP